VLHACAAKSFLALPYVSTNQTMDRTVSNLFSRCRTLAPTKHLVLTYQRSHFDRPCCTLDRTAPSATRRRRRRQGAADESDRPAGRRGGPRNAPDKLVVASPCHVPSDSIAYQTHSLDDGFMRGAWCGGNSGLLLLASKSSLVWMLSDSSQSTCVGVDWGGI